MIEAVEFILYSACFAGAVSAGLVAVIMANRGKNERLDRANTKRFR